MADHDDERRVLRWIAENGGPPGTVNLAARTGELELDPDELGEVLESLEDRELIETLDDGDVHLTSFGRAFTESSDG
jgi:hypothetical protein